MGVILAFVVGLILGALVNRAADVLPANGQPPRCRACGAPRSVCFSLPELLLPRHCPACRAVDRRPLWVALTSAFLNSYLWHRFGVSLQLVFIGAYTVVLLLILVIDIEHRLVLNRVLASAALLALIGSWIVGVPDLLHALLGGVIGFGIFLVIALAKPGGMGGGDVKLAGLIGLITGYPLVLVALFLGIVAGGVGAALLLVSGQVRKGSYVPYAPFLTLGAWLTLL
ncbi:MAG TPA: prepilin peptidase, partial [Anaerolineae bacterium]|nr:prepilin peptidase [Anaerolineae bacterium]